MKLLKISALSDLGICQTQFLDRILGRIERTPLMETGEKHHEKMTEGMEQITHEDIVNHVKNGERFTVREVSVKSDKMKLVGRIDQIDFLGMKNNKNQAIVTDDKFTRRYRAEIPNYYKLQLSGYTSALKLDENFAGFVEVVGVRLAFHDIESRRHLNTFEVGADILSEWEDKIPGVVDEALKIIEKGDPKHFSFDMSEGKWTDCVTHMGHKK